MGYANCTINGFTIENSGTSDAGIKIVQLAGIPGHYNNISNNIVKNNHEGIYLMQSYTIITENIIFNNNDAGITASSNNIISHNEIFSNNGHGVSIYSDNNTISDNNVSYNGYSNIYLAGSKNNTISNNTIKYDAFSNYGIRISGSCYYNTIINNTILSTYESEEIVPPGPGAAVYIRLSNHNYVIANIFNKTNGAIGLSQSNYNLIRDNNIFNNYRGIEIKESHDNLIYHNNLINNTEQASDDGCNNWDNGSTEGGNYWSDHNCTGNPSNGSEPYSIEDEWPAPTPAPTAAPTPESEQYYSEGGGVDHYPFEDPNGWIHVENFIFDTGSPINPYPSIFGTHIGKIKPNHDVIVNRMYTYACPGTGGHTEYVRFENESWNITVNWTGYKGDWHNITFDEPFTLYAGFTYNYTIRTGSYPQIHHNTTLKVSDGEITCTKFTDENGRVYYEWLPAIRLE
jgi:parallel beta-helix repeat protein